MTKTSININQTHTSSFFRQIVYTENKMFKFWKKNSTVKPIDPQSEIKIAWGEPLNERQAGGTKENQWIVFLKQNKGQNKNVKQLAHEYKRVKRNDLCLPERLIAEQNEHVILDQQNKLTKLKQELDACKANEKLYALGFKNKTPLKSKTPSPKSKNQNSDKLFADIESQIAKMEAQAVSMKQYAKEARKSTHAMKLRSMKN